MDREKWIEKKLESINRMERAKAPDGAYSKIQQRISVQKSGTSKSGFRWMAVAAVILIALCSNAIIVSNYLSSSEVVEPQNEDLYVISDFSLYENE